MKYILATVSALALAAGLAATPASAGPNLIVNGSFDLPNVGGGFGVFPNGNVPGWTSNNNETEIDFTPILGLPCFSGIGGCQSMEANGTTFDTISQTVAGLTVGEKYLLSWGYGDRPGTGPQQLDVTFGGSLVTSDIGTGAGTWTPNSFTVTTTATSEILSYAAVDISGIGGTPGAGNEVGAVSLTGVPEPVSLALLGVGLAGLGLARRKRVQ